MEMVSRVPKFEGPKFDSMLNATMQASITSCVWHVAMAIVTDMYGSVAVLCRNWRSFYCLFQLHHHIQSEDSWISVKERDHICMHFIDVLTQKSCRYSWFIKHVCVTSWGNIASPVNVVILVYKWKHVAVPFRIGWIAMFKASLNFH